MNCEHAGLFPRLVDTGVVGQGRITRLWFGREAGLCGPQVMAEGMKLSFQVFLEKGCDVTRCLSSVCEVLGSVTGTAEAGRTKHYERHG